MIEITREKVVSLTDATKWVPNRTRGRKVHVGTLYRWSTKGCRGVVLETIAVGGTRCTSVEALQRFFERLTLGDELESLVRADAPRAPRTEATLQAAGIARGELGSAA